MDLQKEARYIENEIKDRYFDGRCCNDISYGFTSQNMYELCIADGAGEYYLDIMVGELCTQPLFIACEERNQKIKIVDKECLMSDKRLFDFGLENRDMIMRIKIIEQILCCNAIKTNGKFLTTYEEGKVYNFKYGIESQNFEILIDEGKLYINKLESLTGTIITSAICSYLKREIYEDIYKEKVKVYPAFNAEIYLEYNYINSILIYLALFNYSRENNVSVKDYLISILKFNNKSKFYEDIKSSCGLSERELVNLFKKNKEFQIYTVKNFYSENEKIMNKSQYGIPKMVDKFIKNIMSETESEDKERVILDLKEHLKSPFFSFVDFNLYR